MEIVLRVLRTTPKKAIGKTPFGLVYVYETVAQTKITFTSHRVKHFESTTNDEQMCLELDLVDEKRWTSEQTQGKMRLATTRYYNRRASSSRFFYGGISMEEK